LNNKKDDNLISESENKKNYGYEYNEDDINEIKKASIDGSAARNFFPADKLPGSAHLVDSNRKRSEKIDQARDKRSVSQLELAMNDQE
jgi:hypothetical protein